MAETIKKTRWLPIAAGVTILAIIVIAVLLYNDYKKKQVAAAAGASGGSGVVAMQTTNAAGQPAVVLAAAPTAAPAPGSSTGGGVLAAIGSAFGIVPPTPALSTGGFSVAPPPTHLPFLGGGAQSVGNLYNTSAAGLSLSISPSGQTLGTPVFVRTGAGSPITPPPPRMP